MVSFSGFESTAKIEISKRDLISILNWGLNCKDNQLEFDDMDESILNDLVTAYNDTSENGIAYDTKPKKPTTVISDEFNQQKDGFRKCECGCTYSNHSNKHPKRCLICTCRGYRPKLEGVVKNNV